MVTRIRILGVNGGDSTEFDNKWLADYDPTRSGRSPSGRPMIAHVRVVDDPRHAMVFPSTKEAFELWQKTDGIRGDGKPNRPLTAFTIQFTNEDS